MKFFKIFTLLLFISRGVSFPQNNDKPKNVIILIGDGMGVSYVSAAVLTIPNNPFQEFSSVGFSITKAANKLITDSAPGASAISTGYRINYLSIAVDTSSYPVKTIFDEAEKLGLSTGIVVTSSITDATPAAFVAHVSNRKEETEIARQFLKKSIEVVIGGGEAYFSDSILIDSRRNGLDILKENGYEMFTDFQDLKSNPPSSNFYALLGKKHLPKKSEREYSLTELTEIALSHLSKNDNGFVLMVEGSQIDWGGHKNDQEYIISELTDFCGAITTSLNFAKNNNTLVLVTADHETGGMSIIDGKIDGSELKMKFNSTGHTAEMVGVFAKGPGEELFRGVYDNYMIGRNLFYLLNPEYKF